MADAKPHWHGALLKELQGPSSLGMAVSGGAVGFSASIIDPAAYVGFLDVGGVPVDRRIPVPFSGVRRSLLHLPPAQQRRGRPDRTRASRRCCRAGYESVGASFDAILHH